MEQSDVKEGFLCPICMQDLRTPTNLSSHFEEVHSEDKDVLKQVRSIFGKAKKKILKSDIASPTAQTVVDEDTNSQAVVVSHGTPWSGGIDLAAWPDQMTGK